MGQPQYHCKACKNTFYGLEKILIHFEKELINKIDNDLYKQGFVAKEKLLDIPENKA